MKIAAVDIGTNAIKSKIFDTSPTSINFIEGIRTPVRLGTEVFEKGFLSKETLKLLVKTLKNYEEYFQNNGINKFEIVATSAFRDTSNSEDARRVLVVIRCTGRIHFAFWSLECVRTGVTLENVDHVLTPIVVHDPVFAFPLVQLDGLEAFYEHISI